MGDAREQQTANTSSLIADLTSALASDPTNALLCLELASAYQASGSLPEAVSYATRALETGSAEVAPMAAMFLGIMYGQLKNFTEAEAAYGIAIESRHEVATPLAASYLAEILRSQGRNAEAASLFKLAIESGDPAVSQISSRELGILLEYAERPVEAEAAYQSAISGPDHDVSVTAAHDLALLYEKERCLRQAEQAYIDLIRGEHAGAAQKAALNLSRLLAQQGRCQEAEVLVRRAAEGPDPGVRVLAADAIQALSNGFRSGIGMSPRLTIEVENTHLRVRGSKALSESPVHRCLKEYLDGNFERARDLALSALDAPTSFQQRGESLLDSALYALVGQRAAENLGDNASADLAFAAAETVWLIPTARWLEHYSILAIDSRITFLTQTGRHEECAALATQILISGMLSTKLVPYLVMCLLGRQYVADYLFQLAIRMVSGEFPALVDSKFDEVDEEVKAALVSSFEVLTRSFDYAVTEASVYKVVASAHHGVPFILWLRSYDLEIAVRPNKRGLFTFAQRANNYEELLLGNIAGPISVVTPLNPTMPPLPQATIPRLPLSLQNWQRTVQFLAAIADLVIMTIGDPTAGVSEELSVLHRMGLSAKVVVLRMPVTGVESDPVIAAVLGALAESSADERQAQAEEFWRGFADAYPGFPSPVRMSGDALVDMGEINTRLSEVLSFLETSASVTRDARLSRRGGRPSGTRRRWRRGGR